MRKYIKDVKDGNRIVLVDNTVYEVVRVITRTGLTSIHYTVEGSHFRGETIFTRASLTTCEVL